MINKNILDSYWEKGNYYSVTPERLFQKPRFPNENDPIMRKFSYVFDKHVKLDSGSKVLEIGCGASAMLPFFNLRKGYEVFGIDSGSYAATLARANLAANNAKGIIVCADALDMKVNKELVGKMDLLMSFGVLEHFDNLTEVLGKITNYIRPGGYIITTVPNFNGVNGLLQKFVDRKILEMHTIHTRRTLQKAHEDVGFTTLRCQYWEVFSGYLTESNLAKNGWRKTLHAKVCRYSNMSFRALLKFSNSCIMPDTKFFSPHIIYIGRKKSCFKEIE